MVELSQLVAHSWSLHLATDGVDARGAEHFQQEHAQPIADLGQGQGGRPLLPPVRSLDQEPHSALSANRLHGLGRSLLLDSGAGVVDVPMSYNPIVVTPLSWHTVFCDGLKNGSSFSDAVNVT